MPVATPEAAAEAGAASAAKPRSAERKGEAAADEALVADSASTPPLVAATRGNACLAAVAAARAARRLRAAALDMGMSFWGFFFRTEKGRRGDLCAKKKSDPFFFDLDLDRLSLSLSFLSLFSLPAPREESTRPIENGVFYK